MEIVVGLLAGIGCCVVPLALGTVFATFTYMRRQKIEDVQYKQAVEWEREHRERK